MKQTLIIALCLISMSTWAQSKKKQDVAAIKEMCGCYKVRFNFAETFAPDRRYEFHKNYKSKGLEWVQLVEEDKNKVSLQHLLIVAPKTIVKHWRQDWIYQNTDFYTYDKDNSWKYKALSKKDVKGQWSQKVYQVDGSLRYEGSSSWVHVDDRHYWENTADSPLPRREYSKRTDYNLMVRTNRQELTPEGWVHEQDNDKVIRSEKGDKLLAQEKGWNTYTKVDDSECKDAQEWWAKNKQYWSDVRQVWDEVFASKSTLTFKRKVDEKVMYERIFALGDKVLETDAYDSQAIQKELTEIISTYRD